uniref:Uncharacterized protein n=1 Tax=Buteo japonicus TaxID=224669 RepID=A0A8C0HGZ4_9AVES
SRAPGKDRGACQGPCGTDTRAGILRPHPSWKRRETTCRERILGASPISATGAAPGFAHLLYILAGKDAGLPACCEVAVNLERVSSAALVGVNPVLTCAGRRGVSTRGRCCCPNCHPSPPATGTAHRQGAVKPPTPQGPNHAVLRL